MRKQLLCGVAAATIVTVLGGPSRAADLGVLTKAPPPVPTCEWCGFYVGANAGYGWRTMVDF
jgi:outer membrane immunogenic protein